VFNPAESTATADPPAPTQAYGAAVEPDSLTGELAILQAPGGTEAHSSEGVAQAEVETVEPHAQDGTTVEDLPEDLLAVAKGLDETDETAGDGTPDAAAVGDDGTAPVGVEARAGETESLDDIAPGTVAAADHEEAGDATEAELVVGGGSSVANWPFVVYVALWFAAAGAGVWKFLQIPAGQAVFDNSLYATSLLVGLGLLALGPVVLLVVWVVTLFTRENAKGGALFISALVKGASATLLGAIIWMGALMLTDFLRVGRLL
jgi:hypothetical protein